LLRGDGKRTRAGASGRAARLRHRLGGAGPRRRIRGAAVRQCDTIGGVVRGGQVQPARDERGAPRHGSAGAAPGAGGTAGRDMKKIVALGICWIVAVEIMVLAALERSWLPVVSGVTLALTLVAVFRL